MQGKENPLTLLSLSCLYLFSPRSPARPQANTTWADLLGISVFQGAWTSSPISGLLRRQFFFFLLTEYIQRLREA